MSNTDNNDITQSKERPVDVCNISCTSKKLGYKINENANDLFR